MIIGKSYSNILLAGVLLFAAVGCSMDDRMNLEGEKVTIAGREFPADVFYQGMVSVKFTEEMAAEMESMIAEDGFVAPSAVRSLENLPENVKVTAIERTFEIGGKYEQRARKYGLHLWYNFYIDEGTALSKAGSGLESIEGVVKVEYRRLMEIAGDSPAEYVAPEEVMQRSNAATEYFNDPYLSKQWHYFNDTTIAGRTIAGCDINVLPVWKEKIVGRPDIIVAVMDEGVFCNHEDLKDNIWNGKDEDGNIIHGKNFCDMNYEIDGDEHGTHVAGTIAAVNNNNIGVAGVAGGDKERGIEGVKIMSCQILKNGGAPDGGYTAPRFPEALQWAADHGAVISQNSWSHPLNGVVNYDVEGAFELDKVAMKYFIECAGMDETGEAQDPDSPMAGGVIIFAAANDDHATKAIPAMFDGCIAVAAVDAKYELGLYSNIGKWVDISAPGGEKIIETSDDDGDSYAQDIEQYKVYSTLPPKKGIAYGYKRGTSMACPHVSGVAALIISKFGGQGFTNADLKTKLLTTVTDIDKYNPGFEGMMGMGMLNAANAVLGVNAEERPAAVTDLKAEAFGDNVVYSFTIPSDDADAFYLVISEEKITNDNYGSGTFTKVSISDMSSGDVFEGKKASNIFSSTLYIGVIMIGDNGGVSNLSNVICVETSDENRFPTIEPLDGSEGSIYNDAVATYRFLVKDEDKHDMKVTFFPNRTYVSMEYIPDNDTVKIFIDGTKAYPGEAKITLCAEDEYRALTEYAFKYTIYAEPTPDVPETPQEPENPEIPEEPGVAPVLTYYPNPVLDNNLYIKGDQGSETVSVRIYTSAGAMVHEVEAYEVGGGASIDMSGLPAGVYSVKATYKGVETVGNVTKL